MTEYKIGEDVTIPTSYLGAKYGVGKIISIWADGNRMAVDFSGHLGHYTVSDHKIHKAINVFGFTFVEDDTIPENEIHIKD